MRDQIPFDWLDYKQLKREDDSPHELEGVPLKKRMKMLRAKAVLVNRNEILAPAV